MKKIEDYLHHYFGCEILIEKSSYNLVHEHSILSGEKYKLTPKLFYLIQDGAMQYTKPILRPLSDMTEKEIIDLFILRAVHHKIEIVREDIKRVSIQGHGFIQIEFKDLESDYQNIDVLYPNQFLYLLKQGFDLFNLIPDGLAIDRCCHERNKKPQC